MNQWLNNNSIMNTFIGYHGVFCTCESDDTAQLIFPNREMLKKEVDFFTLLSLPHWDASCMSFFYQLGKIAHW